MNATDFDVEVGEFAGNPCKFCEANDLCERESSDQGLNPYSSKCLSTAVPVGSATILVRREQRVPCSPGCQGHITHPCESCGLQWS